MKILRKCECCRRKATKKIFYSRNGRKKLMYCDDCHKFLKKLRKG